MRRDVAEVVRALALDPLPSSNMVGTPLAEDTIGLPASAAVGEI